MHAIQKAGLLLCLYGAAVQAYADTDQAVEPSGQDAAASVNVKGGGPCNFVSQKGTYSFSEARRITAATISFNGKSAHVPFSGSSFTPPLRERDWSDDSVVELTFDND
jgi:hypothetical protein